LIAPKRGPAPPAPDGYEQDANNPYTYIPILEDCEYRIEEFINCKDRKVDVCKLYCDRDDEYVTKGICKDCEGTIDIGPQEVQSSEETRVEDELQFSPEDSESGSVWSGDGQ